MFDFSKRVERIGERIKEIEIGWNLIPAIFIRISQYSDFDIKVVFFFDKINDF
jgi:hypothetical protein